MFLELLSNMLLGILILFIVLIVIFVIVVVSLFVLAYFSPDWYVENIRGIYENTVEVV